MSVQLVCDSAGMERVGQVPEWSKGADLRSAVQRTRGFEPHPAHID